MTLQAEEPKISHAETLMAAIDSEDEEVLAHYGVLGMKWGVRKDRRARSTSSSSDTTAKKPKKKSASSSIKSMSNSEIQERIARIRMEQELSRLMTPSPTAGREFIKGVLKNSGQQILTKTLTSGGVYLSGKLLGKAVGPDLERMIIGGGGKDKKK